MKKLKHVLDDGTVIELAVPHCIKDCPYCHGLGCSIDRDNERKFTMHEKDSMDKGTPYPEWCPLEEETLAEELARKHRQEQEMHRV